MALPMVHLLAAWRWAQDKPELKDNPEYYLGAISPDAIHIRDGNDKSHKNEVHFNNWRSPDPNRVLGYWRENAAPFDIGYGIHVLLDGQWTLRFKQRLPQMLLPSGKPNPQIYYNDTCFTDFALYETHPQLSLLMELLKQAIPPSTHPMLTAEEFLGWRDEIFRFYRRPCPATAARYITPEYVEAFLQDCTELFDWTYGRFLMMNDTQKSILDRRSTRGFSDVPLTEAELQTLFDAALAAPTARNLQEWHFIFLKDKRLIGEFSQNFNRCMKAKTGESRFDSYDVFFNAPLVVFITLPETPSTRFAEVDAGIAVENLALSAHAMGLGSVIVGMPMELFMSEMGAAWQKKLGFPADHRFAIGIVIGHNTITKEAHPIGENKISVIG